eukprot:gene27354-33040_t
MATSSNPLNSSIVAMDQYREPQISGSNDEMHSRASEERQSTFIRDLASEYDFCVVLPASKGDLSERSKGYIKTLRMLGFEIFMYKNLDPENEVILLLRAPLEKLRAYADQIDFVMLLDPEQIKKQLEEGDAESKIAPVTISHMEEISPYEPYDYIYAKFSRNINEILYWREDDAETPFREMIRLKLCALILESRSHGRKEALKIRRYIRSGWMKAVFPLHNKVRTELLSMKWSRFPFQRIPLDDVKEYFGEKIGLYFVFMDHYTKFLAIPAVIGIPLQIAVFATNDYSAPFLPFFSFFMALWAVCMLEFWKRREKTVSMTWGTLEFESAEVDRADFKGEQINSFIDGSPMRYFSTKKRMALLYQSILSIATIIMLVVGIVVSIYILRYALSSDIGDSNAQTVASICNALQIQIVNYIYSIVANALSERENHRTDTQYEDSMIAKIFIFQFVNSYASFFYLAFIAQFVGDCPSDGCMSTLTINLAIIFFTRLVTGNALEILIPYLSYKFKYLKLIAMHWGKISRPEAEARLEKYDTMSSSLEEYAEVAIQFGYTALFVTALPMAAACALLSNIMEMKGDGWKMLNVYQRPFPKGAQDIGTWQTIFLMIAIAAVITNAGLTVFTMDALDDYSLTFRFWVFILFQYVCFSLQGLIMAAIPDIPEEIEIQQARTTFIVDKLVDKVADDVDDDVKGLGDTELEYQTYPLVGGVYSNSPHKVHY